MKKIWIILGIVLLTTVITTTLLVLVPKPEKVEGKEEPVETVAPEPILLFSYDIEDAFVTNMKSSNRFVRASISLVINKEEDLAVLEKNIFIIRDRIIGILRGTTEEEYLDNSSQENLRQKIKVELSSCLTIESLVEIYFTELVVQ